MFDFVRTSLESGIGEIWHKINSISIYEASVYPLHYKFRLTHPQYAVVPIQYQWDLLPRSKSFPLAPQVALLR
jgi:hypothetical protein